MISRFLFLLIFILTTLPVIAQRETDNWYFGQNASLEFNAAGTPVSFQNSAMVAPLGSASVSDRQGNLLFYTDGETVWNRLHQVMANGLAIGGSKAARQPAIIIPKPGSNSRYYIFTKKAPLAITVAQSNLQYSEVDMLANGGIGEVIAATKNTPLLGSSFIVYDKLTAVHHANHQDFWVITIREGSNNQQEFAAVKVTAAGVDPNPVISSHAKPIAQSMYQGDMKASPDGKRLAVAYNYTGVVFDFNNFTGQISNPLVLFTNNAALSLNSGVEFSMDGSKVYFAGGSTIDQFNLALGNPSSIIASKFMVAFNSTNGAALQLARNGKIYVNYNNTNSLMEIVFPDAAGAGCNFQTGPRLATNTFNRMGFPNFIQSYFAVPRFMFNGICAQSPTVFTIPNATNIDSVRWHFGDPASGTANTNTALQPSHTFIAPGIYTVQLNVYQSGLHSVFEQDITVLNKPLVDIGKDTSVCEGTTVYLTNLYPVNPFNERFRWSNGNTDSTILKVTAPGIYWLELTNGVCTTRDSVIVQYRQKPKVNLGPDRLVCGNSPIILNAGNPGATYYWSPTGETTQTIAATRPGVYTVTVTQNRCDATDDVSISINQIPGFDFGEDITVCEGEPVVLKTFPAASGNFYTWSDGSKNAELTVTESGKYWATVLSNGCTFSDTVRVNFKVCPPPIVPDIPNIISPNNDNRNDKLVIGKIPLDAWSLKIYNRWGKLIYTADRYNNNWPEKELLDGTYYYLLEEPESNRKFKGWLEVVK